MSKPFSPPPTQYQRLVWKLRYGRIQVPEENLWEESDQPVEGSYRSKHIIEPDSLEYLHKMDPADYLHQEDNPFPKGTLEYSFKQTLPQETYQTTGTGHSPTVFGGVSARLLQFMQKKNPKYLAYTAASPKRFGLYAKLAKRIAEESGYGVEEIPIDDSVRSWLFKSKYAREWPNENTTDPWEKATLEHLNNNPEDWGTHGIYADWLEERGRTDEAEFHRNQADVMGQGTRKVPYTLTNDNGGVSLSPQEPKPLTERHIQREQETGQASPIRSMVGSKLFKFLPRDNLYGSSTGLREVRESQGEARNPLAAFRSKEDAYTAIKRAFLRMKARQGKLPLSTLPPKPFPRRMERVKSPPGGIIIRGLYYQGGKWIPVKHTENAKPITTPIPPVVGYSK